MFKKSFILKHKDNLSKANFRNLSSVYRLCFKLSLCFILQSTFIVQSALAIPVENPEATVQRKVGEKIIQSILTRNLTKTEKYQAPYMDKEPYQAEETYYEKVPYQEQESYTDQEPYETTETYYENVPYQEQESYTDYEPYWDREYVCENHYENECNQERVCHTVPGERECRQEQVCRTVPGEKICRSERLCEPTPGDRNCEMVEECGTNALGERICKTRKVCHDGPPRENCRNVEKCEPGPSRQDCHYENQCHTGSSREECGYENRCHQVPKQRCEYKNVQKERAVTKYRTVTKYRKEARTRTVTKYRDVTKYRTVTKYRDEKRTRTVTKYRDVEKCCITKEREVFDKQVSKNIRILFPENTDLIDNEIENFQIQLNSKATDLDVEILESVFGYQVADILKTADGFDVQLKMVPKYKSADLGLKAIEKLKFISKKQKGILVVKDLGLKQRVNSLYTVTVFEKSTHTVVKEKTFPIGSQIKNSEFSLDLELDIVEAKDYTAEILIQREGLVLDKPVSFKTSTDYLFDRIPESDVNSNTISAFQVKEQADGVLVQFVDSVKDERIQSVFQLSIQNLMTQEWIFNSNIDKNMALIPLSKFDDKSTYQMVLTVTRNSNFLVKPVVFTLTVNYERILDTKAFMNKDLVSSPEIQGQGSKAVLKFSDKAPKNESVITKYKIKIERNGGFLGLSKKTMADLTIDAKDIKNMNSTTGEIRLGLVNDLKMSSDQLNKYLDDSAKVYIHLEVQRQSPRLNNGKLVIIEKYKEMRVSN